MKKISNKGFTLIELLATILIIGLVLGVTTYGIIISVNKAKEKSTILSLASIKEAARTYSGELGEDSWKNINDYEDTYFCVTIEELINKGLLNKNANSVENGGKIVDYVVVIKNKTNKVIEKEEILTDESDSNAEAYKICTGNIRNEVITSETKIDKISSYTDSVDIDFIDAGFEESEIKESYCEYGESSTNMNNNGTIKDNTCTLEKLTQGTTYYTKVCGKSKSEIESVSCSDTVYVTTKNIVAPSIAVDTNNSVIINYYNSDNNSNINGKVTVTGTSDIGFDTQRDDFSRAFAQNYEIISNSGIVSEKETAPGIINHIISFGTDETTFTCDYNINAHLAEQLINARENLLSRYNSNIPPDVPPDNESLKLGTVSYTFTNRSNTAGEFNKIKLVYDLSRLTYGDVKNLSKYSNINNNFWDYADSIIYANKSVTLKGNGETYQNLSCNEVSVTEQSTKNSAGVFGFKQEVLIQAGALNEQTIGISYDFLRTGNIGLGGISLLTYSDSESAISQIDKAIEKVSEQRAVFGAYTNRLERAYNVNMNNSENTQAAESRIRDTDVSEELIDYSKQNILSQVGQSMLAQANQQDKQVLSLIE